MEMYGRPAEQTVAANDAKPISITDELVEMRKMQLESHLMILEIIWKLYGEELRPEEAPPITECCVTADERTAAWKAVLNKFVEEQDAAD